MELIRVAADTNASKTGQYTVVGAFIVGAAANCSALIYDAVTVTGTEKFGVSTLANTTSTPIKFDSGGVQFKTGISVDLTGAGAVLYLMVA
jgi:hypothetical protein